MLYGLYSMNDQHPSLYFVLLVGYFVSSFFCLLSFVVIFRCSVGVKNNIMTNFMCPYYFYFLATFPFSLIVLTK